MLILSKMPATEIAPQESTIPPAMATAPAKPKRTRRTKAQIEADKLAKQQENSNVTQPVSNEEVKAQQSGEGSNGVESSDVPPWEDPAKYESALTQGSQPTDAQTVGSTGPDTVSTGESASGVVTHQESRDIYKLGAVGSEWNIGGKRHQLIFANYDVKVFRQIHD